MSIDHEQELRDALSAALDDVNWSSREAVRV